MVRDYVDLNNVVMNKFNFAYYDKIFKMFFVLSKHYQYCQTKLAIINNDYIH